MILTLHHQHFGLPDDGSGTPLVILHGLFGSLENWGSQARQLGAAHPVYALDLRNHGRSPHSERMDYPLMARDVLHTLDQLGLERVLLMGHSMGGKAAMQLALDAPQRVAKLLVVDIAPRSYPRQHDDIFNALRELDLAALASRQAADAAIVERVPDPSIRSFLLKNLQRNASGGFRWKMNLDALYCEYENIALQPHGDTPYRGPTLFIKGGLSDYIQRGDREAILRLFPTAGYKIIHGAGHWPHVEKPGPFSKIALDFLAAD